MEWLDARKWDSLGPSEGMSNKEDLMGTTNDHKFVGGQLHQLLLFSTKPRRELKGSPQNFTQAAQGQSTFTIEILLSNLVDHPG